MGLYLVIRERWGCSFCDRPCNITTFWPVCRIKCLKFSILFVIIVLAMYCPDESASIV